MNNVTFKSPLSISDIEAIEKHCLEFSRYAKKVSNTFGIDWVDFDKKIRDSVRKLGIASLMFRKRIICVRF